MSNGQLAIAYVLLAVPLVVSLGYDLRRGREILWVTLRMTVQLGLVGLYIEALFAIDSPWLNAAWILVMIAVAGTAIVGKAQLTRSLTFVTVVSVSLIPGVVGPVAILMLAVRPEPWFTAPIVVPLVGMVLGNSLRGNIIALSHFRESLSRDRALYASRLLAGATRREAIRPVVRGALQASLAPQLASIATIGLVSLPGMMTGQILGGAAPLTAIRYQVAIMLTILAAVSLASLLNLTLATRILLDDHDMPRFR